MKLEEISPELEASLKEKALLCKTPEERLKFLEENDIELTDEQLEFIAGGSVDNEKRKDCKEHKWVLTGRTRTALIWRDVWPNYEYRCEKCGRTGWNWHKWGMGF